MARAKKPVEAVSGGYAAVPWRLLDSQAFIGASDRAKSLLYALMRQHTGSNNGRLQLTEKWLASHGWPSVGMNLKSREELIERGLIIQTRRGGLNRGCNWFALSWLSISNFVGLDIAASAYYPGAWAACELKPTARRKPPEKRVTPSVHRSCTTPTTGAGELVAPPTIGAEKVLSSTFTAPYTGDNVLNQYPTCKPARRNKPIVGKAGCSGKPKAPQSEPSSREVF